MSNETSSGNYYLEHDEAFKACASRNLILPPQLGSFYQGRSVYSACELAEYILAAEEQSNEAKGT